MSKKWKKTKVEKMNRTAAMTNIGFVMGTGRNDPATTDAVFRIVGADDYLSFRNKLRSAGDDQLRSVLETIDRMQPGVLPRGWQESAKAHHDDVLHSEEFVQAAAQTMSHPEEKAEWTDYARWAGRVAGLVALATGNPAPLIMSLAGDLIQELYNDHVAPEQAARQVENEVKSMSKNKSERIDPFSDPGLAGAYKRDARIQALRRIISGLSSPTLNMPGREADAAKVNAAKVELAELLRGKSLDKTGSPWYVDRNDAGQYVITDQNGVPRDGTYATYSQAEHAATEQHRKRQKSTDEYVELVADRLGIDGDVELEADKLKSITKEMFGGAQVWERSPGQWVVHDIRAGKDRGTYTSYTQAVAAAASMGYKSKAVSIDSVKPATRFVAADFMDKPKAPGYGKFIVDQRGLVRNVINITPDGKVLSDSGVHISRDGMLYDTLQEANAIAAKKSFTPTVGKRVRVLRADNYNRFAKTIQKNQQVVLNLDGRGAVGKVTKVQGTDAWVEVKKKSHFVKLGAILKGVEEPGVIGMINEMDGKMLVDLDDGSQAEVDADGDAFVPEEVEGELLGPFEDEDAAVSFAADLNDIAVAEH